MLWFKIFKMEKKIFFNLKLVKVFIEYIKVYEFMFLVLFIIED